MAGTDGQGGGWQDSVLTAIVVLVAIVLLGGATTPPPAGSEEMIQRGVSLGTLILGLFVSVRALFKAGQDASSPSFLSGKGLEFEHARTAGLTVATGAALVFVGNFVRP